jgi:hypothetical protein
MEDSLIVTQRLRPRWASHIDAQQFFPNVKWSLANGRISHNTLKLSLVHRSHLEGQRMVESAMRDLIRSNTIARKW